MTTILNEFDGCDLGDARREARLLMLAEALAKDPGLSFPEALPQRAALEACYRLVNNENVDSQALLRPHVLATAARLHEHARVLAVHDSTHFQPSAKAIREGFGARGFWAHATLAVAADGRREPLGLLGLEAWPSPEDKNETTTTTTTKSTRTTKTGRTTKTTTTKATKRRPSTEERRHDDKRLSKRWLRASLAAEAVVSGVVLIHVEDREADIYACMEARLKAGMHFIVRAQSYRKVVVADDVENILEHMRGQPHGLRRQAHLSRRQVKPGMKSSHQSREGREVQLTMAAAPVVVRRSLKDRSNVAASLSLNAVHVVEVDAPEGEQPVEWLLLTTEPIGTDAEIEFVVDSYRARWVIEEYFKALKTGCAYESRQLESYDALLNALSIFAVIAWQLLWMRFAAQHETAESVSSVVSDDELAVLTAQARIGADPTVQDVMRGIAKLGGHLKWNGEPGWEVLWRGFRTLRLLASGLALGRKLELERSDQW